MRSGIILTRTQNERKNQSTPLKSQTSCPYSPPQPHKTYPYSLPSPPEPNKTYPHSHHSPNSPPQQPLHLPPLPIQHPTTSLLPPPPNHLPSLGRIPHQHIRHHPKPLRRRRLKPHRAAVIGRDARPLRLVVRRRRRALLPPHDVSAPSERVRVGRGLLAGEEDDAEVRYQGGEIIGDIL